MLEQETAVRIDGSMVYLRLAQETDLEDYLCFLQDPELSKLTGSQQEFTREQIITWLRKIGAHQEDRIDLMIVHMDTNKFLGEVVLNEIDAINRSANIRIGIQGTQHRGNGYGTESMLLMLRYGFETLKLHRIHLGVYAFNPRAIRVYEKIGFKREGLQRDVLYMDNEYHNMIMMAILEDEFRLLHG